MRYSSCHRPVTLRRLVSRRCHSSTHAFGSADELTKWIQSSNGFIHSNIKLEGREVKAISPIPASTLIASIPNHCQIQTDIPTDPSLESIFNQLPVGSKSGKTGAWSYKLAVILLWLRKHGSHHLPHLTMLPGLCRSNTVTPRIGFTLDEKLVSEAQYLPLIEAVLNQRYFVDSFYESVLSVLPDTHPLYPVSRDEFHWALAVSSSRSFHVQSSRTHSMPAFIDMIDHNPATANVEVKIEDGVFNLFSKPQIIAAGDSLRLSYGNLDNLNLILSFGFTMPENSADRFEFDFASILGSISFLMDPEQRISPWKLTMLNQLGIVSTSSGESAERVFFRAPSPQHPSPVDPKLLAATHILLCSDAKQEEFQVEVSKFSDGHGSTLGLWPPLDSKALDLLSSLAVALYKGMGTTLQQDILERKRLAEMQEGDLESLMLLIDYRIAMKKTLEKALVSIRSI